MARSAVEVDIIVNNFPRIIDRFPTVVRDIIAKATMDVYAMSQTTVPVLTAALKSSGGMQISNDEGVVRYTINYAIYVHEGTRRMPARPFLNNALADVTPGMLAAFRSLESRL